MINIPDNVLNPELYRKAKEEADDKFDEKTSAYKSMWMVKRYQEMGGKYKGKKKEDDTGTWREEEWIQVIPFVTKNEIIPCGSAIRDNKACRPLKKATEDTPYTIKEIVKMHGKEKVIELAEKKIKDMKGRLDWKKGTFTPSK
jgi:hypothetical protein